jgi:adenine deaminase
MTASAISVALRQRAIRAAQGHEPFDLLVTGGRIIDVSTMEVREADIGIVGEMIASVHPRGAFSVAARTFDAAGRWIAPGFIDGHVHFESSHMLPHHYACVVVPQGTTTVFCDPHELANVLGVDGLRYAVEASRGLPLRFIVQASSCVPAAPGLETSGADFTQREIRELLAWPEIAGLAEVMDMRAVLEASPRMVGILSEALASGKIVEGHARGLTGGALQAYLAAGISADHEITSGADALEKLRAGMTVEIRGSHDHLLPDIVAALRSLPVVPTTLTICTDDVFPDDLVEQGGMVSVMRRLVARGMDPLQVIRCATANNAIRLRRDDLGVVCAGRRADLVVLGELSQLRVEDVFVDGRHAACGGALREAPAAADVSLPTDTVKLAKLGADAFRIPVPEVGGSGRAVLRTIKGARFTSWSEMEVEVRDGHAVVPPGASLMTVVHRHGRGDAKPHTAIIEGWGTLRGAVATTYAHDSHNLVVYGRDPHDMAIAANALVECGGGIVVVQDRRVLALAAYPVAGILSPDTPREVADAYKAVREATDRVIEWEPPYRVFKALSGQCLACNPGPHLTDLGMTCGTTRTILPAFLRAA